MGKLMDKKGEVIEFILDEKEIEELTKKLQMLKESKDHLHFNIDENNELMISHEESELNKHYDLEK